MANRDGRERGFLYWFATALSMAPLLAVDCALCAAEQPNSVATDRVAASPKAPLVATFSIVAYDPEHKQWGVAVQSRVLAVGAIAPAAKAEVGAIATQSYANTTFKPRGLELLAQGQNAQQVLDKLLADDPQREERQVAIVDGQGQVANFTGKKCLTWAGAASGKHYSCQGNILAGEKVVKEMANAFETSKGTLAERMIAALTAGQQAGGDRRGQQSAALLVVKKGAGYGGFDDRMLDLRVDDHTAPVAELARLLQLATQPEK